MVHPNISYWDVDQPGPQNRPYQYTAVREDHKNERVTATGRYTDVLIKEGNRWLFIAWAGGDDPKD